MTYGDKKFKQKSFEVQWESKSPTSPIQWGSEYRPFEYPKQLNTELFKVQISNG